MHKPALAGTTIWKMRRVWEGGRKSTIRLVLGWSQPFLPFPTPILSLVTPSEETEAGWINDRNIESAPSQGKSGRAGSLEGNRTPPSESAALASSSWWLQPHSVNLGTRPIWVCILISQLGTIRPRKKASSSWTFRSPTCKLLQITKATIEKTKWDQPTSLCETPGRVGHRLIHFPSPHWSQTSGEAVPQIGGSKL